MTSINEILSQDGMLNAIFQNIPCGILVVDQDRRVKALNNVLQQTYDLDPETVLDEKSGEVLRCIHSLDSPEGCGHGTHCATCQVRLTVERALKGDRVFRNKAKAQLSVKGTIREVSLLVSATSFKYENQKLAVVILEDISELNVLRRIVRAESSFAGIVGRDAKMLDVFESIRELAGVRVPVLIQGESGTGKELAANAIHTEGLREKKNFVPVNCSALPEPLLESELFGHVKGAFTGAIRDRKGRFELADGGTIFLDEVADLSPAMQVKLLRVLQEGAFERVGGEKTIKVDARVISASNKDLRREVAEGRFRSDLFYRLCVVPVYLPALRERRDDIHLLVEHILNKIAKESGRGPVAIGPELLDALMAYDWPGNVRELENAIQYGLVKCRGDNLLKKHFPPNIFTDSPPDYRASKKSRKRKLDLDGVREALRESGGNKSAAARILGVGRATLYRFLVDSGLENENGS